MAAKSIHYLGFPGGPPSPINSEALSDDFLAELGVEVVPLNLPHPSNFQLYRPPSPPPAAAASAVAATPSTFRLGTSRVVLHRHQVDRIRIGTQFRSPSPAEDVSMSLPNQSSPHISAAAAPTKSIEQRWEDAILTRAKKLFDTFWYSVRTHVSEYDEETQRKRILTNVRAHAAHGRQQPCEGRHHAPFGCPGAFVPETYFDETQFAHFNTTTTKVSKVTAATGKSKDAQKIYQKCRNGATTTFKEFLKTGRIKWTVCHKVETEVEETKRKRN